MKVEWLPCAHRFEIDDETLKRLRIVYPFFDKELLKMEIWVIANWNRPDGKKGRGQKKNWHRFIVNWLNRVKVKESVRGPARRDYKREEKEFREKMERAAREASPPTDDWKKLLDSLKPKGI